MAEANPISSFQDIHPTAGNLGAKDSVGRNLAREINRQEASANRARAVRGGGGGWSNVAKNIVNFNKRTSDLGVIRIGSGGLNIGAAINEIHKELDWG